MEKNYSWRVIYLFNLKVHLDYSYDKMWVKRTPEELIWGYDEPLFDLAELGGFTNLPPNGKFGFFTKVSVVPY